MPFTNYKSLKERMAEINKGFWKVQSIHKLSTRLANRFNTKDFIIMKTIQRTPKYIPPFISFSNENKKYNISPKKYLKIKSKSKENKKFFLTTENIKKINEAKAKNKKEVKKKLYLNLYKNFPYEPYLYNELQFIYLQGNNKLIPRKFNEVVKDCFIMDKYNKFLQKSKYNISSLNSNNCKNISKFTLMSNVSKNNNFEDKYTKSLNAERRISNKRKHMNKRCKTEKEELSINKNYLNTMYDGFNKRNRSRKFNLLPSLGNRYLTDGTTC